MANASALALCPCFLCNHCLVKGMLMEVMQLNRCTPVQALRNTADEHTPTQSGGDGTKLHSSQTPEHAAPTKRKLSCCDMAKQEISDQQLPFSNSREALPVETALSQAVARATARMTNEPDGSRKGKGPPKKGDGARSKKKK